jgi:hypothetical protein
VPRRPEARVRRLESGGRVDLGLVERLVADQRLGERIEAVAGKAVQIDVVG